MNYEQTLDFLFSALPMYQRVGNSAFKKDLNNTLALCSALDNPQNKFKSVHVAGTNGKGSCSHSIAAVLQCAGYKVGLYTSPHLKSFTERIRINGQEIDQDAVVNFVKDNKATIEEIKPSFFEMTVAMAFDHFAKHEVDIAVIEVGLGGRLDSTNVINPLVGLITNIGLDHTEMLGDTLEEIAFEKAGIIKPGIPVVIGQTQKETEEVFKKMAQEKSARLCFADQQERFNADYDLDLKGEYQRKNLPGVITCLKILNELAFDIDEEDIKNGLSNVTKLTGLKGRWQILSNEPITICDTGHNKEAFKLIVSQIEGLQYERLHLVLGFVDDKNVSQLLEMLPNDAQVYLCEANVPRAMNLEKLEKITGKFFPEARYIKDVNEARKVAKSNSTSEDLIFIGGSTFVVAELNDL